MSKEFKLTDIVVFDNIITTFGVIKPLVDIDEIRLATKEEIEIYNNKTK